MKMVNNKYRLSRAYLLIWSVVIGISFYGMNQCAISIMDDDIYHFLIMDNGKRYMSLLDEDSCTPIQSIQDIVISQRNNYLNSDGRVIVHGLVQLFCSIVDLNCYFIINSIVFIFSLFIIGKISWQRPIKWSDLFIGWILVWFVMRKAAFMNDIACSINYLWPTAANLLLVYIIDQLYVSQVRYRNFKVFVCALFACLTGALQESFSIPFAGALLLYYAFFLSNRNKDIMIILIGYIVGSALCVFAPGNFVRATEAGLNISTLPLAPIRRFFTTPSVVILVTVLLFLRIKDKTYFAEFVKRNALLFLSLICGFLLICLVAYTGERQLSFIDVLSIVLLLKIWNERIELPKYILFILPVIIVVFVLHYRWIYNERIELKKAYSLIMERAKQSPIVVTYEYDRIADEINDNYFNKVFFTSIYPLKHRRLSLIITNGRNLNYIHQLLPDSPENIVNYCNTDTREVIGNVYLLDNGFYAYKSGQEIDSKKLRLECLQNSLDPRMSNVTLFLRPCEEAKIGNNYYYFFKYINLKKIVAVKL